MQHEVVVCRSRAVFLTMSLNENAMCTSVHMFGKVRAHMELAVHTEYDSMIGSNQVTIAV